MKINDVMNTIKMLAQSQGYYKRLYDRMMEIKETDIEQWAVVVEMLENKNFNDAIDIVMYFEN